MTSGPALPTYFLIILELMFCVLLYFSYLCLDRYRCRQNLQRSESPPPTAASCLIPDEGLDASVVDKFFPTFTYKDVKDQVLIDVDKDDDDRRGEEVELILECAVCFIPFEDDDVLRLIPICEHVFHCKCIDPWFKFRSTCPYCRVDLSPPDRCSLEDLSDSERSEVASEADSVSEDPKTGGDAIVLVTMLEQSRTDASVKRTAQLPGEPGRDTIHGEVGCLLKSCSLPPEDSCAKSARPRGDGDGESMPHCARKEMFERI